MRASWRPGKRFGQTFLSMERANEFERPDQPAVSRILAGLLAEPYSGGLAAYCLIDGRNYR